MSDKIDLGGLTFSRLVESFAAPKPTPGGGAAAALSGALGASLSAMALRFSVPKGEVAGELFDLAASFEEVAHALIKAADDDCRAYGNVHGAFKLPKNTDEEKSSRKQAITAAIVGAMDSPLALMRQLLGQIEKLASNAGAIKPALASDLVSAAWCYRSGCEMAWLNVKVNAESLPTDPRGAAALAEGEEIRGKVATLFAEISPAD